MKLRFFAVLLLAAASLSPPSSALPAAAQPTEAVSGDALAACFDAQAATAPFAGVVLARKDDQDFFRASGFRDGAQQQPIGRDTRFRVASVTKLVTRTAIARLVDQGRVSLDAPAATYLAQLPAAHGAVTIDQLLHHRSGIPSLLRLADLSEEERSIVLDGATAGARLPVIAARPLEFAPGERQSYSNGGYFLLGAVIEAVSGRDYDAFVAEEIFRPLGMASAGTHIDAATAVPMSRMPNSPGQPPLAAARPLADMGSSRGGSAGGLIATADDLARLGEAIAGGRFVRPETAARVYSRRGPGGAIRQNGGNIGQNADLLVFPGGWVLAVLANQDPPSAELMSGALAALIAEGACRTLAPGSVQRPL